MSKSGKLLLRVLALLAVFALVAAACGDDEEATDNATDDSTSTDDSADAPAGDSADDSTDDSADDSADDDSMDDSTDDDGECVGIDTGETGVTATTISVAIIVSQTGNNSSGQQGVEEGIEAYIDNLNDLGGVCGRTIDYETYDDTSEPTVQGELFRQAVEDDGHFLVMGSWPNWGAAAYGDENGIPAVGTRYNNGWDYSDNFFGVTGGSWEAPDKKINDLPTVPPPGATGAIDVYLMAKTGATVAATVGYTHAASAAHATTTCENIDLLAFGDVGCQSAGGFTNSTMEFGFSTIGAVGTQAKARGATYFYAVMDIAGCVTYSNELKKAGVEEFLFRCQVGIEDANVEAFGSDLDNIIIMLTGVDFNSSDPAMVDFVDNLEFWKPGADPGITTLAGWQSGIFLEDALVEVGADLTRENFITTARTADRFKAWDANGLLGTPIDWTTNRHEAILAGNYEPATGCSGTLWRADVDAGTFVQVGPEVLCIAGLSGDAIKDYVDTDTSSLEVG
jgi:Periplasmic binding protein